MPGFCGLVIAQRTLDKVQKLHVAHTPGMGLCHAPNLPFKEIGPLCRQQHARLTCQRGIHIGRIQRLGHCPFLQPLFVTSQALLERVPKLAGSGQPCLLPAAALIGYPAVVVGDGPGQQCRAGFLHVPGQVKAEQAR